MFISYQVNACLPLFQWAGIIQRGAIKSFYSDSTLSDVDVQHLIDFCFPTKEPISGPISYVFRFKPNNSDVFLNIFCLLDQTSFQLTDLETNEQCCICIASSFYHFEVFDEILKIIRSLLLRSFSSAQNFIQALHDKPSSLISHCPCLSSLLQSSNSFLKSSNDCALKALNSIEVLDSHLIAHIIMSLIADTSIIVISSDIGKLSRFCYSICAALYPLSWHHLFRQLSPSALQLLLCTFSITSHKIHVSRLCINSISLTKSKISISDFHSF